MQNNMVTSLVRKFYLQTETRRNQYIACVLGLILGILSLVISPSTTLLSLIICVFIYAVLKRSEVILLGFLLVTSTIISPENVPSISIGVGTIYLTDIILLASFVLIIVRLLVEPDFKLIHTPLNFPLLAFYSIALLATSIAILRSNLSLNSSLGELRTVTNYLTLFLVINLVRTKKQVELFLSGFLIISTAVALTMIVQYMLGVEIPFLPGRVELLRTEGDSFATITRIIPPGEALVVVSFIIMSTASIIERAKLISLLKFVQWGLLGLAVLLTFKRNVWIGLTLIFLFLLYLVDNRNRQRILKWGLVIGALLAVILPVILSQPKTEAAQLVNASMERILSLVVTDTYQDPQSSLRMRDIEYEYAFDQIASTPVLGLGLGAMYRPSLPGPEGNDAAFQRWLHNGHVWIMLKTGILGYLFFAWFSILFLLRGLKYWKAIPNLRFKATVLGFALAYIVILISSIVNANIMIAYWTPIIGIMMGINEVILRVSLPTNGASLSRILDETE
jgi:O-antigen ligase